MNAKKKVWILLYSLVIIGAVILSCWALLNAKRNMRVKDRIVQRYIDTSDTILIKGSDIKIIEEQDGQIYARGKRDIYRKNTVTFRNNADSKFYKIEYYSIYASDIPTRLDLYIVVNEKYNKGKGMSAEPIIVLNYLTEEFSGLEPELTNDKYFKNVQEYLTYKDYTYTPFASLEKMLLIIFIMLAISVAIHASRLK